MKKRAKYMSDEDFSELQESLEQALEHAQRFKTVAAEGQPAMRAMAG